MRRSILRCSPSRVRAVQQNSAQHRRFVSSDVPSRSKFVMQRVKELGDVKPFPRWRGDHPLLSAQDFKKYVQDDRACREALAKNKTFPNTVTVYGRIKAKRKQGANLVFFDLGSSYGSTQTMIELKSLQNAGAGLNLDDFKQFSSSVKRGDWIAVSGYPHVSSSGEETLLATQLPQLVSPSLQPVSLFLSNPEFRSRNRHVERIIDPSANDIIRFRSMMIKAIRSWFEDRAFIEVNTPILVAGAGGAVARPFVTYATEFSGTKLHLRVAPELFLKRLIVGGIDKVFELGLAFRNEGVDLTHNPEFSICEYYEAMANLPKLMSDTELFFKQLAEEAAKLSERFDTIPKPDVSQFVGPFRQLEFIPALEAAIQNKIPSWKFPVLTSMPQTEAQSFFAETCTKLGIDLPSVVTLPKLLDQLAGELLESQCKEPVWLMHHPECMSPLAKSFTKDGHVMSARAELFIDHREYVNCYEEENDPLEQRRKFVEQARFQTLIGADGKGNHATEPGGRDSVDQSFTEANETGASIDESYIAALEWGLPPTGGWGCGIDRLIMLFGGRQRIADVLPFGTLTNVVAMGPKKER